jgi:hypothetical protein
MDYKQRSEKSSGIRFSTQLEREMALPETNNQLLQAEYSSRSESQPEHHVVREDLWREYYEDRNGNER